MEDGRCSEAGQEEWYDSTAKDLIAMQASTRAEFGPGQSLGGSHEEGRRRLLVTRLSRLLELLIVKEVSPSPPSERASLEVALADIRSSRNWA